MATLSNQQLDRLRQSWRDSTGVPTYTKPQLNALFQAIEDWGIANQASAGAAMNAALPGTSAAQRKIAFAVWAHEKFLADK
jgi:hypothetical protein